MYIILLNQKKGVVINNPKKLLLFCQRLTLSVLVYRHFPISFDI